MGTEASKPIPGRTLQVIGAGLPRTGTASMSEALRILLKGPVYHGGTQTTLGPERNVLGWTQVLWANPPDAPENRDLVMRRLEEMLSGFVAVTDTPAHMYVAELLELWPDAKVIVTTRDVDAWAASLDKLAETSIQPFLRFALFWLPSLRHFPNYCDALALGRWGLLYGPHQGSPYVKHRDVYERHMAYLRRVVSADKLTFVDVRDGWGPLCKALDVPVPDVAFPRVNDGAATEKFAKDKVRDGLLRWGAVLGGVVAVGWGLAAAWANVTGFEGMEDAWRGGL